MTVPALPSVGHDPSTGAIIPASWGDDVNSVASWVMTTKPRARVYRAALFNHTSSGNWLGIPMGNEGPPAYDIGGCHSTSADTERLTAPDDGLYTMGGCVRFDSNATGIRGLRIVVNGADVVVKHLSNPVNTDHTMALGCTDYPLEAGDYIELQAYQNTGGTLAMTPENPASHVFFFRWVATL